MTPDPTPDTSSAPRRRRGRPPRHSREDLLAKGYTRYVEHPRRVRDATVSSVASALGVAETTFADIYSTVQSDGRRTRVGALPRFFGDLGEWTRSRTDLTVDQRRLLEEFNNAVRAKFPAPSDSAVRKFVAEVARANDDRTARKVAGRCLSYLRRMDLGRAQVNGGAALLLALRRHLPVDRTPGAGLKLEMGVIDVIRVGLMTLSGTYFATGFWGHPALPQLQLFDADLTAAVLVAEAKARHGVEPDAARSHASPRASSRTKGKLRRLNEAVALGRVRGLVDRGDLEAAIGAFKPDVDDGLLLWTCVRLYHLCTFTGDDAARDTVTAAIRRRVATLNDEAQRAGPEYDGPDDFALDEAMAVAQSPESKRIDHLATLVSTQLADRHWRTSATGWSTAESVEVLAAELERSGRNTETATVVSDLLQVAGWPPHPEGLDGNGLAVADRTTLERIAARYPVAIPPTDAISETLAVRLGVDTEVWSTRRLRGRGSTLPAVTSGVMLDQIFVHSRTLGRDRIGDRIRDDELRQIGWLLELRASRRRCS